MYLRYHLLDDQKDAMILLARILILILYGYFGFTYVTDNDSFVEYLISVDAPMPRVTAIIGAIVEFFGGIALLLGFWTRPLAALFAVYTIGTGLIGHAYWSLTDPVAHHTQFVHFFKNVSIAGGFLFLALLGPGRYSIDGR